VLATISFPILERIPLFGDAAVSPHGIGIALGFLIGARLLVTRVRKRGLGHTYVPDLDEAVQSLLVRAALGAVLGARLFFVLNNLDVYADDPLAIVRVWEGGLTFLGGVAGAIILVLPAIRRQGLRPMQALDSAAPGLALGLAVGRTGDLVIGDHIGAPTDFVLGWRCTGNYWDQATNGFAFNPALPYPSGAASLPTQGCFDAAVHQTAMYDFLAAGIVFLLLVAYERRPRWDGFFVATWVFGYGFLRFLSDFAREDRRVLGLTGSQYAILATMLAVLVWILVRKPWERTPWAWDLRFEHPWLEPPDGTTGDAEPDDTDGADGAAATTAGAATPPAGGGAPPDGPPTDGRPG
jgi:phosphatidylglycerol:prolipoprotein diacylglycerol transferase